MSKKKKDESPELPKWMRNHSVDLSMTDAREKWPTLMQLLLPSVKEDKVTCLGGSIKIHLSGGHVWVTFTRPTEGMMAKVCYNSLMGLFEALELTLAGGACPWEQTWEAKKKGLPPPV